IKTHSFSKEFLKETISLHWKPLLVSGIVYPFAIYFYFLNISISGYAIAAFLLYTGGLFFLTFLILTKEEEVSKITIFSFILAIIGVSIIMEFWTGQGLTSGIIFGLLSGFFLGIFVFYKKKIYNTRRRESNRIQANGDFDIFLTFFATLFIILLFLPFGIQDLPNLTILDFIFCLILGLFPTALAFYLYNVGIKNDEGGNIVILSYFETVMATINTIIFLGYLSIYTIIGGSLILLANFIVLKYSKYPIKINFKRKSIKSDK
ncbi:MAG: DMT family transporter, partial [Candidatus Hermodarchaeota archaeon]